MQQFRRNNLAQMGMVGSAVGLLITLIIAVLIFYNISASTVPTSPAPSAGVYKHAIYNATLNATESISDQAATFFTIAPIVAVVIVAVVVISYVSKIGG